MENKKSILFMVLSTLNRKSVVDIEARNNYKLVIYDYIQDIEGLEKINVSQQSSAYKHKEYLNKLNILSDRYQSIGDDVIPFTHLDSFLATLQEMMRDYLDNNIDLEIYRLEHYHYTDLVKQGPSESTQNYQRLAQLKQMTLPILSKRPNLG
jgi:hypothetical protein